MILDWIDGLGADYSDFVWRAVMDSRTFRTFRRNRKYNEILEHVSQDLGRQYLEMIRDAEVRSICLSSERADTIGDPRRFTYENAYISPSTLRYGKVLQDFIDLFPEMGKWAQIVEVGGGYGGQARMLMEYTRLRGTKLTDYYLVDIPPVLELSRLYLEHFNFDTRVHYLSKSQVPNDVVFDLAISNYAFSEFSRNLQNGYIQRVFRKSRSGYLTMNTGLTHSLHYLSKRPGCWTAEELKAAFPRGTFQDEIPKTGGNNFIFVYGDHCIADEEDSREQVSADNRYV